MSLPKISIITVCFNAENTIEKTIESVTNQTYENIEYLIIDGQSYDKTLSIAGNYKSKISKIISEPDSGIYNAMNKGITLSTGDYLLFLNADDYLLSTTVVENYMAQISDSKHSDIFYGNILIYNHLNGFGKIWKAHKKVTGKLLYNSTIPHPSTIFRRAVFEDLGTYNESYKITADHEFYIKSFVNGKKFQHVNILTALFSIGGISTSDDNSKLIKLERQRAIEFHFTAYQRFILRIRVRLKKLINI
tara:strand:- start:3688 stop:4431 length:744 start_codon:yes stop_codon:yes gene_type:complete